MISSLLSFIKTPPGKTLLFALAVVFLFLFLNRPGHWEGQAPVSGETKLPQLAGSLDGIRPGGDVEKDVVSEVSKEFTPFLAERATAPVEEKITSREFVPAGRLILSFADEPPVPVKAPIVKKTEVQLPPGLLIQCRLFNGIESNLPETPLIAHTIREVRINAVTIIPAHSEIHGSVRPDDQRKRVMTGTQWQVVTPDGKVIKVNGIGLNRDYRADKGVYGSNDGFAGIQGVEIRQDAAATRELFAASALSAVGNLTQQRSRSIYGEEVAASVQNGALAGATAVTDRYAEMKLKEVEKNQPFIRVPAGTEFYVYTQAGVEVEEKPQALPEVISALKQREQLLNELQTKVHPSGDGIPKP